MFSQILSPANINMKMIQKEPFVLYKRILFIAKFLLAACLHLSRLYNHVGLLLDQIFAYSHNLVQKMFAVFLVRYIFIDCFVCEFHSSTASTVSGAVPNHVSTEHADTSIFSIFMTQISLTTVIRKLDWTPTTGRNNKQHLMEHLREAISTLWKIFIEFPVDLECKSTKSSRL